MDAIALAARTDSLARMGDIENLGYDNGLNASIPIEWQNPADLLSFRLMPGYNQLSGGSFTTGVASPVVRESTINKRGVNGGAGLEFGIGTSSLFIETRVVNVFAGRDDEPNFSSVFGERGTSVRWVPLILGFTIR